MCIFKPIIKVKQLGAQLTNIQVFFDEYIDFEDVDSNTFGVFVTSENTQNKPVNIKVIDVKRINDKSILLTLIGRQDIKALKLLRLIEDLEKHIFTQQICNLKCKLMQNKEIKKLNGAIYNIDTNYRQQEIKYEDIECFKQYMYKDINYRLYKDVDRNKLHPLIIWLHGAGEGGINASNIMADKGAVTYLSEHTQKLFDEPYILAPQCPTYWVDNFKMNEHLILHRQRDYTEDLIELILAVINEYPNIYRNRIYLAGASMGGYQSLRLLAQSPDLFAGAIISCPAQIPQDVCLQKIKESNMPIWFIHCKKDEIVPVSNTEYIYNFLAQNTIKVTYYENVIVDGKEINPHCVFIYMYENLPKNQDVDLFLWLSKQQKNNKEST